MDSAIRPLWDADMSMSLLKMSMVDVDVSAATVLLCDTAHLSVS